MKKAIIKACVCLITFVLAVLVIGKIQNRGNNDITVEMSAATLPLVYINYGGNNINCLHGYNQEMDVSYMRDVITPIGLDRVVNLSIDEFNTKVTSVSYEVRSADGNRLIENTEVYDFSEQGSKITASIKLKDLIEKNVEYELVLLLGDAAGNTIRYYSRIIELENTTAGEEIAFVLDFHNRLFDKNEARAIAQYLETDTTGDNTNYGYVNIRSSFQQITWGDLDVSVVSEPQLSITELFSETARMKLTYYVNVVLGEEVRKCRVEEYYRLRYGTERIYLLYYERTMNQVFELEQRAFNNNKIDLGIRSEEVEMKESDDGGVFAFVSENRLFCYNSSNNRFSQLFGFYAKGEEDERTYYDNNNIRVLNIDEAGNVHFLVYGYMNRGTHEGHMGIAEYVFNSMNNTIEEKMFIPYDKSYATLHSDMSQLVYLNNSNELYLYLDGSIYCINLELSGYEVVADNLAQDDMKVSESNRLVAWSSGDDAQRSESLLKMDFNEKNLSTINADSGDYIRPLGFMEEDLIYGSVSQNDLFLDVAGNLVTPMYKVEIFSDTEQYVTMKYEKGNTYVLDISIDENQVNMTRANKNGNGSFVTTTDDQIMSSESENQMANTVSIVATENLEKIYQLAAKSTISTKSLKFMTTKEIVFDGGHEVAINFADDLDKKYYVYNAEGIDGVYAKASDAIKSAESISGTVLNEQGEYVWIKANRIKVNQIMKIRAEAISEGNSSLAVCLDTMLGAEGITRNSQYLLSQGKSVLSVLGDEMPEGTEVLDLGGCSLDSVLYYVSKDIPVLAILKDKSAVLIVGYNELNTVIMDPQTGTIYKKGINDSTEWFKENGNQFITYLVHQEK